MKNGAKAADSGTKKFSGKHIKRAATPFKADEAVVVPGTNGQVVRLIPVRIPGYPTYF